MYQGKKDNVWQTFEGEKSPALLVSGDLGTIGKAR